MSELSVTQLSRQDYVDNCIFRLLNELNTNEEALDWNIEQIATIREAIRVILLRTVPHFDENRFYPFGEF